MKDGKDGNGEDGVMNLVRIDGSIAKDLFF
jgi:hypothetical protein